MKSNGDTLSHSSQPLVTAPTPVQGTSQQDITVPPAPCRALPRERWDGPNLAPPPPPPFPPHHLPPCSRYSSGSPSHPTPAKVTRSVSPLTAPTQQPFDWSATCFAVWIIYELKSVTLKKKWVFFFGEVAIREIQRVMGMYLDWLDGRLIKPADLFAKKHLLMSPPRRLSSCQAPPPAANPHRFPLRRSAPTLLRPRLSAPTSPNTPPDPSPPGRAPPP